MNLDSTTVDRIVAGVLNQLAGVGDATAVASRRDDVVADGNGDSGAVLGVDVVTADVLVGALDGDMRVIVDETAIVTPAAWDAARERGVEVLRRPFAGHLKCPAKPGSAPSKSGVSRPLMAVVRNTEALDRLWDELRSNWRRELLDCPDDAAALATSAICRGETDTVVILAEQLHRAACLANRNARIKAVAVRDVGDVRQVRRQLRANAWCLDPTNLSWFELRNLFRAVATAET